MGLPCGGQAAPSLSEAALWPAGVRVLRQDPVECLFSFLCTTNNHLARITGMIERLCRAFGRRLCQLDAEPYHAFPSLQALAGECVRPPNLPAGSPTLSCPPSQLAGTPCPPLPVPPQPAALCPSTPLPPPAASPAPTLWLTCCSGAGVDAERRLRALGFGYRAKFVSQSAQAVLRQFGAEGLHQLRSTPYPEARRLLCALPGVGAKVSAGAPGGLLSPQPPGAGPGNRAPSCSMLRAGGATGDVYGRSSSM